MILKKVNKLIVKKMFIRDIVMKLSFSDIISIISILIAFFVGLYATFVTRKVATSDFQAVELVKSETAQLIAALRALLMKGVIWSQQDKKRRDDPNFEGFVDTRPERKSIEKFLHSSTALAYYVFVARKSKEAREANKKGEKWRIFFLQLFELIHINHPWNAALFAAKLERFFDGINDDDIYEIAKNLENLPRAIELLIEERKHDPIIQAMFLMTNKTINEENFIDFIKFLRKVKKIKDPEVDMFWAAHSGDLDLIKKAKLNGADLNVRSGEIIERYSDYITEFIEWYENLKNK